MAASVLLHDHVIWLTHARNGG